MNPGRPLGALAGLLLAAGCASFDGRGLVESGSTAARVEEVMGPPAAVVEIAGGGKVLYFSRLPAGRQIFAVTLGADGRAREVKPLLTRENIDRLKPGVMSAAQVRELLGPPEPREVMRLAPQQRDVWTYPWMDFEDRRMLSVQFSDDGILREVVDLRDDYHVSPGGGLP